eukprot:964499-Rhodomonas_salina.1
MGPVVGGVEYWVQVRVKAQSVEEGGRRSKTAEEEEEERERLETESSDEREGGRERERDEVLWLLRYQEAPADGVRSGRHAARDPLAHAP